jgi:flagellin
LKINSNSHSLKVQKELKETQNELQESSLNLASGKRVNKSADNAADLSQAAHSNAELRSKGQAYQNANQMISILQVGEGAISEITDMVMRMRELALQSASDGIGSGERTSLNIEVKRLKEEIHRISKTTIYNGVDIFSGEDKKLDFHVDSGNGKRDKISVNLKDLAQSPWALGIFDVSIDTQLHANNSLYKLDSALRQLNKSRAKLGSVNSRVASVIGKLDVDKYNIANYKSKLEDADIAYEKSRNVKAQMQQKTQIFVESYVQLDPNAALKLI